MKTSCLLIFALCVPVMAAHSNHAKHLPRERPSSGKLTPRSSASKSLGHIHPDDFNHVTYLSKSQIFQMYPDLASGTYGWPGDGKHPGIPIYQAAKNSNQFHWQVEEYNRMLHMAQEDIRMSNQADAFEQKNTTLFNDAAAIGDTATMKSLSGQSRDIVQQMMKYGYDQENHLFKALGLHRTLVQNAEFRDGYSEQGRAVDFAHTPPLVQKTNADELRFVADRSSFTADRSQDVPAPPPFSSEENDAVRTLSTIAQNTKDALAAHQVIFTADVTSVFNYIAEINLSVENNSSKPIQFMTVPTMFYGNGYFSAVKIRKVNDAMFPAPQDQMSNALAAASRSGNGVYGGEMSIGGYDPTSQNTVIAPGGILYIRASCPLYGDDQRPTRFEFKGGGWDNAIIRF